MAELELTEKQSLLFDHFEDDSISEILLGGCAGGGKSFSVCALVIINCLRHAGIRVLIGRSRLKTLKATTYVSFKEASEHLGVKKGVHWDINNITNIITFKNGSEVHLKDLFQYPSDEEFTDLGGLLLTFAVIDEAGEVVHRAKSILTSRVGRWLNKESGISPKLIMTCNPSSNFLKEEFYLPKMNGTLPSYRKFIMTTQHDNPYLDDSYWENLNRMPELDRQRLLLGNWDYEENDGTRLVDYEDLEQMYLNIPKERNPKAKGYISADIAFSSDKCVIVRWLDDTIEDIKVLKEGEMPEDVILKWHREYKIPMRNIVYDADGVGGYLKNKLRGAVSFRGNGKVKKKENYQNLRSQIFFKNAEMIRDGVIKNRVKEHKEVILKELYAIKTIPLDTMDGKLRIISKKDIKREVGHSTDFADAIAYKRIFDYQGSGRVLIIGK